MHVDTVTTSDGSLLRAVRSTLSSADDVLLCVAFVHEKGLHPEIKRDPVFSTLGRTPKPNRVVDLTPVEVYVETERSLERTGQANAIPAWMFNLAWDRLRTHGPLSNRELLDDLRVHRSSAVCAILARLPAVERVPGNEIRLAWRPVAVSSGPG